MSALRNSGTNCDDFIARPDRKLENATIKTLLKTSEQQFTGTFRISADRLTSYGGQNSGLRIGHSMECWRKWPSRASHVRHFTNFHKPIIDPEDLRKIAAYFQSAEFSPVKLRQSVWYNLSVHFVSRGLEFHHQLRRDSYVFDHDDKGGEYVTLSHECLQKNFQGGLNSEEAESDKRMYATGRADCPLKLLRLLMDRTDHTAMHLFNCCNQDALASPSTLNPWFGTKPLTKRTFAGFMPDVSKSAGCSKRYTAHSLRATAIQAMSDAGYEARHIMFMSGHRNESSIRSYSRNLSSGQKRSLSNTLSSVASATVTSDCNELVPVSNPTLALTRPGPTVPGIESTTMPSIMPHDMPSAASSSSNVLTSFQSSAGLLSNCSFANCNFTFNKWNYHVIDLHEHHNSYKS